MIEIDKDELMQVRKAPLLKTFTDGELEQYIKSIVKHVMVLRCQPQNIDDVHVMTNELCKFLKKHRYGQMTLGEVSMALEMGARGELDNRETYASIANMESWLRKFSECQTRIDIIDEMRAAEKVQLPEPTDEEKNNAMYAQRLPEVYAYFCETGDVFATSDPRGIHEPMLGAVLYDHLVETGMAMSFPQSTLDWLADEAVDMMREYRSKARFIVHDDSEETFYKCLLLRENMRQRKNA